jgi:GDP-4-dehydro-6-deoxy-D-mannose reductase
LKSVIGMRVLITGARGFVGPYVYQALRNTCGNDVAIVATSKEGGRHAVLGEVESLDVTVTAAVQSAIARHQPTHVVHLAGVAAPVAAQVDPRNAWRIHLDGTLNVAHAILECAPDCWLLYVGSGLVYGESAKSEAPLDESKLLAPIDEYSVTKAAADLAMGALARRGLKCIRLRPFNHTGPGQTEAFVVPAFAMQIARIEAGLTPPIIYVGNLEAERDFLDVRDVARAYALAVLKSGELSPGVIFNVASGVARRMSNILEQLLAQSSIEIKTRQDATRLRPSDLPRVVGDASRARAQLGWAPQYPFEGTLTAILNDCRARA